jgi:hypothetical protein
MKRSSGFVISDQYRDFVGKKLSVKKTEVLDFLMAYESYLRKRRYEPTGKHGHSLR